MLPRPMVSQNLYLRDQLILKYSASGLFSVGNPTEFPTDVLKLLLFRSAGNTGHFQRSPEVVESFKCTVCMQEFKTRQGLNQHMGKVHLEYDKQSPCPECGKKFKHKFAVRYHVKQVHEKTTRVSCEICGLSLYNKYELARHIKNKHHV